MDTQASNLSARYSANHHSAIASENSLPPRAYGARMSTAFNAAHDDSQPPHTLYADSPRYIEPSTCERSASVPEDREVMIVLDGPLREVPLTTTAPTR